MLIEKKHIQQLSTETNTAENTIITVANTKEII